MSTTLFDEAACLGFDPFQGDFGDGEILLSDKIVSGRRDYAAKCFECAGDIHKGERHRARTEAYEGKVVTTRWCPECCAAQAISYTDGGEALEARHRLGVERRQQAKGLSND